MKLLALDTATEAMAVGLADGDARRAVNADGGPLTSERLVPVALELLAERGLAPADLDAVAFGQGPGAFTGLRTAVAVAQGLAFGIGCPVVPVDSLLIVAEDARAQALGAEASDALAPPVFDTWVAMDARMDEAYVAHYRHDGRAWAVLRPPALVDLPTLAAWWQLAPPAQVAGSGVEAFADRLPFGAARRWPRAADRAGALLRLALAAASAGRRCAARDARRVSGRDWVALPRAARAAARAAAAAPAPAPGSGR
ncbi:tRNA (adenosine(37)-N6)-threonylcarbamoyltransferase complex dimerization subunit type 1 TsaB [Ideonella sp.]|uniref:tRNA (adenosine(37)-N6)-threonylcarbamoyltransferase complex dimerization subunit type 1 TsaB n=1 Tax=Ideonella sp. TaxID=1929293 RepID=UPI0035B22AFA